MVTLLMQLTLLATHNMTKTDGSGYSVHTGQKLTTPKAASVQRFRFSFVIFLCYTIKYTPANTFITMWSVVLYLFIDRI